MATIDNLSIQVTASAESAASAFDRLASSAGGLRGAATRAGGGMRDLAAGAKDAGTATQEAGQQAGNAEKHTRNFGRASEEAGKAAKRGTAGISDFWQALKRVAYYRFIRTIIKEITTAFKEGLGAVYDWSKSVGGSFASNIDSIKSSVNLLKGSLGALAAPLVESLTPAINGVINVLITMINAFNIAIAAINGQDTYTMAVRGSNAVANSFGTISNELANVASNAKEVKRTIMGFDEINKLQAIDTGSGSGGGGSSGGGGGSGGGGLDGITFVEKPLEGIWKKISDITEGLPDWLKWLLTGTALVGGFKLISWLIDKIKDFLSGLVNFSIPDWVKWLFGPKDGNNPGIDIPDHIDIPDGKIKVDVEKGDWSALDEITGKSVYVSPKLDNQGGVLFNKFEDEWDAARTPLYVSPKLDNTGAVLWNGIKSEWDDAGSKTLYLSPKLDNGADTLYANFKNEWDAQGSKVLYFSPKLDNGADTLYKNFKAEWDAQGSKALYFSPKLDNTAKALYDGFIKDWNDVGSKTLYLSPKLDNTGTVLWNTFKGEWDDAATGVYATPKLSNQGGLLWAAFKKEWDAAATGLYASPKLDNQGSVLWAAFKKEWDSAAETLKVKVELDYSGTDGFGGATGGGGTTSGGGVGRSIKINVEPETTVGGKTFWERAKEAIDAVGTAIDKGLDVVVRPALNSAGDKITGIVKWLFGSDNTPDVTTTINGTAGTGFTLNKDKFGIAKIDPVNVTVDGTPGTGFVDKISGNQKFTLTGIEDATANVNAKLSSTPASGSTTLTKIFGVSFDVQSKLTGSTNDSNTTVDIFGSTFNVQSNLTGATNDSNTLTGVYGDSFNTRSDLKGKVKDTNSLTDVYGTDFNTRSDLKGKVKDSKGLTGVYGTDFDTRSDLKGKVKDSKSLTDIYGSSFDVKASLDSGSSQRLKSAATKALKGIKVTVKAKSDSGGAKLETKKSGGAILPSGQQIAFSNGGFISNHIAHMFSNIKRYASGTTNAHGTMFLAGEAGPEIIGHVGGRTEILNQSQLAQTMFAAVRSAMGGVKIAATMYNGGGDNDEADYEMMYRAMYDAFTDAMAGSNERDREKVQLMRQIAAKEFTAEVTAASMNRAQTRMNRRAGTTIVPVGT